MFVIDRNKELVGHSRWLWDSLYAPVVGCFRDGRLVAVATCNHEPQRVRLEGPMHRSWFRMRVSGETREAIEDGDPSVMLLRLEDGAPVPFAERQADDVPLQRVEDLMARVSTQRHGRLDGFPSFVAAPIRHQLDIVFLDYLNRLPDGEARTHYLGQIDQGMSILTIRDNILLAEEFWQRGIGVSDAVGGLVTSPIWKELAAGEPLGEMRPRMRRLRVSDYTGLSDHEFARGVYRDCHGNEPTEGVVNGVADVASRHGRGFATSLLVRDAANGGLFFEFVDD